MKCMAHLNHISTLVLCMVSKYDKHSAVMLSNLATKLEVMGPFISHNKPLSSCIRRLVGHVQTVDTFSLIGSHQLLIS